MGIRNRSLAAVVVGQGLLAGIAGALPGCLLGAAVVRGIRSQGLEAALRPALAAITVLAVLLTCAAAAATSIQRVSKLEPALVFRT